MNAKIEPMQQPVHKVVGSPPTISRRLAHLQDLAGFLKKHAHASLARAEGDYFPIERLLAALAADRVDFAVVGGLAVISLQRLSAVN